MYMRMHVCTGLYVHIHYVIISKHAPEDMEALCGVAYKDPTSHDYMQVETTEKMSFFSDNDNGVNQKP